MGRRPFAGIYGASRTRTGDLLGAISEASAPRFGLVKRLSGSRDDSPNIFPNSLQRVRHFDNGVVICGC
jgi:hypothetical protein